MRKFLFGLLTISLICMACESEKPEMILLNPAEVRADFTQMLEAYYDGSMALDPLRATQKGDYRFNAEFPDYLSKSYKDSSIAFYKRFKKTAETFDNQYLLANDTISKAILLWECNIKLQTLKFRNELFPLDQMWTRNFVMGQFASGLSAQPFKTVEDYDNWLQRLDGFVVWLDTAQERMREGASLRFVLPSSLLLKLYLS